MHDIPVNPPADRNAPVRVPIGRAPMSKKQERQNVIRQLLGSHEISSQEELKGLLAARGMTVTQATLSRDLRDLGVMRAPGEEGARYMLPEMVMDEAKPSLDGLLPQLFSRIDGVGELLVLHTLPSGAQPIAEALDGQAWPEIIGTLAGENTVLIICRSPEGREALTRRIVELASAG
jgi:transcriptional regulator of arginine metabolism